MRKIFIKTIVLTALCCFSFKITKAQYVTIPNPNFAAFLTNHYPTCMNGNMLDTTCSEILNAITVNINGLYIHDLTGIEYFKNLDSLFCNNMYLTFLPTLPDSLIYLDCSDNSISSLSSLPNSLVRFDCSGNLISSFPSLPSSLMSLDCSFNQIDSLPSLPNSLWFLYASVNNLTYVPTLPNSLVLFWCANNQLTQMPDLPSTLSHFMCSQNQLTILPELPISLDDFSCEYNQLTELPELYATIDRLVCHHNNILCFPTFPLGLGTSGIFIDNNPATCLPNYIPTMTADALAMPLCDASNSNGCESATGIIGKVFKENNINCALDSTDLMLKNIKVKFFNPVNSQFGLTYTAINGVYDYPAGYGTYFVMVDTLNQMYQSNCAYPGIDSTVVTTSLSPLVSNVNFDLACNPGIDLSVQAINHTENLIFPGQQHVLEVLVGDASQWYGLNCATGVGGQVQITILGPVTYNGAAPGALTPVVNGNVFTYSIADFGVIDFATSFRLLLITNTTAQLGDRICAHVEITSNVGDIDTSNNVMDFCYDVVNSYDPNYKEVYPTDVPPFFQDWLTYTIHFQNLGNAPAINIRLLDTLDNNLEVETFEVINYSHYNTVTLMNGILDFRFPNILLPDSASNPSGSQGFVQYRIKPKANLPVGTQIENTAHIYFDYNPAVVTNTTVNNFTATVGSTTLPQTSSLWLYPNPSNGIFTVSAAANIEVYNLIGELIMSENNTTSIDLTAVTEGMYFVRLNGDKIEKLIKK